MCRPAERAEYNCRGEEVRGSDSSHARRGFARTGTRTSWRGTGRWPCASSAGCVSGSGNERQHHEAMFTKLSARKTQILSRTSGASVVPGTGDVPRRSDAIDLPLSHGRPNLRSSCPAPYPPALRSASGMPEAQHRVLIALMPVGMQPHQRLAAETAPPTAVAPAVLNTRVMRRSITTTLLRLSTLFLLLPPSTVAAQTAASPAPGTPDQTTAQKTVVAPVSVLVEARRAFQLRSRHLEGRRPAALDGRGAVHARKDLGLQSGEHLGVGRLQRRVRDRRRRRS